ncbi:tRNA-uridine aminocarboxypropyltransferase [Microbulbifer aggregans]|uniref:tRNA-uridine aminocarboxypropyltransferase n=1 Tax=Microbulbifer aggregans TaxID=1769779 RepID=UPI00299F179D|nr:tRNA-uridine aminocarboxypropyltransferase [Microbulbifer aggregans]
MQIILLTHERELDRPTNTGSLAVSVAGGGVGLVRRIVWSRTAPDQELLADVNKPGIGLLYPTTEVEGEEINAAECENFILLDGTWQEARKMYNRSPYLQSVSRVSLGSAQSSRYRLRRNQKAGGLCTAECVVEILRVKGQQALAAALEAEFFEFNIRTN